MTGPWPTQTLEKLITLEKGKKAPDVFATPSNTRLRYLQIADLRPGATFKYCEPFNCPRATKADVVIAWDGANAGTVSCNLEGHIGSTLAVLRPAAEGILRPPFLSRFLQSKFDYLQSTAIGATIPHISKSALTSLAIPVPPLEEQDRIVRLLDEADELQRLRVEADHDTNGLLPALFYQMFGDPDANPFSWPIKRAGELMTACDYGTSQKANGDGVGVPVLRMGNVGVDGRLDLANIKHIELSDSELENYQLRSGDVLFNRTNSRELVGKTGMWDGRFEAVAASYFIRVRFREDMEHPQHFTMFMNLPSMKRRLASMARGAVGQANINAKELRAIEIPVPPIERQREFAARADEVRLLQGAQSVSGHRLNDLRQSMLQRAFLKEL